MSPANQSALIVLQPDGIQIPAGILDLRGFRAWVHTGEFPKRGRIDWVATRMEVDMAPEDLNAHGSPKSAIAIGLGALVQERRLGMVFIDRTRYTCPAADLSVEPDVLVVLLESLDAGRLRLVPRVSGEAGRYVELEGAADLVVECVSDSSERKDLLALPEAYHKAGVREYWLVDARHERVSFNILVRGDVGYEPASASADGFLRSEVLDTEFRLVRDRESAGLVFYRLDTRAPRPSDR